MVSVLVITGPVGVGKSLLLREVDPILASAGPAHASVDLEELARCWAPGTGNRTAMRRAASRGERAAICKAGGLERPAVG